jgi:transcription termination factor Rho
LSSVSRSFRYDDATTNEIGTLLHVSDGVAWQSDKFGSLVFDRKVADKRVFPAIDVAKSGTRKEDLLVARDQLKKMYVLRRILNPMGPMDGIEFLLDKLRSTKTNSEFFQSMNT